MREITKIIIEMDMEFTFIQEDKFTKENGKTMIETVKVFGISKKDQQEKEHFRMTKK
jgi:hypothetical protein